MIAKNQFAMLLSSLPQTSVKIGEICLTMVHYKKNNDAVA